MNNFDSFDQLLEPFGQDIPVQMTIQDGQGAPYFLDKLNIRFLSNFVIDDSKQRTSNQLSAAEIDELVKWGLEANKGSATDKEPSFMNDTYADKDALAQEEIHSWSPWYTLFRQQWVSGMKVSEHESFMHPVACMLVASGSETDPIGTLQSLQKHPAVQRVQSQSFAGSNVLLYYVLVHDERDESIRQTVDLKFDQVRRALGQNTALLKINSNTSLLDADYNDERAKISAIWTGHMAAQSPLTLVQEHKGQSAYGAMMTMQDVSALRETLKQMMVRSVVPHMQYRIRVLSDQTANQRRGITGRLFSAGRRYFGAATKASSTQTNSAGDAYYRYESPEGMLRKLADYSFMLKDFRFAQSVYQVAKRDSQSEKVWLCYAGAQEMVGICKLMWEMAQANKAEFESSFQDAIATYVQKTHALSRQFFAVRCAFLYYELLKQYKLYSFTPGALLRMPMYSTGLLALTNEQTAYSYLKRVRRPEMRKFAFYAMVAAQCYQKSNMSDMSSRCLRMARWALSCKPQKDIEGEDETTISNPGKESTATANSKWAAIDSYVNHELGRQYMAASNYTEALQYFMALMGDDKVPAKLQSKYLQELLQLYMESSDDNSASTELSSHVELAIPLINPELARIIMSPELEGEDGMLTWQLDGTMPASVSLEELSEDCHCCSVGETVAVLLVVTNPLTVGITLNSFSLDCQFTPPAASDATADSGGQEPFKISSVGSVILEGGQTTMVTVEIVAQQPGYVSIKGATYMLCDILPTFKSLMIPGKRLNQTKEDKVGAATYSPDTTLGLKVSADLPCLRISLEEFPDTLMSGSMHMANLTIANSGTQPCNSVLLWVSHPSFFGVKSPQLTTDVEESDQQQSMYVTQSNVKTMDKATVANVLQDSSTFVVVSGNPTSEAQNNNDDGDGVRSLHIVPVNGLEPGATVSVPVWVRGDRVGAHTLKVCVGASASSAPSLSLLQESTSKVNNKDICLRSRRFELDLVVTPSLRVNAFVRPSIRFPQQKLLGIEVENMQPDLHIELVQITFTSGFFEMVPLSTKDKDKGKKSVVSIGPNQSVNLVYHVRPLAAVNNKDRGSSSSPEQFALDALQKYIYSEEKPTAYPEPIELVYSNHTFGNEGIDSRHPALQNYLSRCQAYRRRNNLNTAYPLIPEKYYPALFPLFESYGIDLVLFWNEVGGGSGRSGHHSISGIDLGVPNDYLNEALNPPVQGTARMWLADTALDREALVRSIASRPVATQQRYEQRPLDISMKACKQGKSDDGSLHSADVEITVYNHSWRYGYSFELVLVSPNEADKDQVDDNADSQAAWAWVGKTQFKSTVEPHGSAVVRAKLVCYMPGMIDIAMWRLHATANINNSISKDVTLLPTYTSRSWECHLNPVQSVFVDMSSSM